MTVLDLFADQPIATSPVQTRRVELNPGQWDVATANDTHLLVSAGAGTGKTTTVVQKICYLLGAPVHDLNGVATRIESPLDLGSIAAVTYTLQAAADLKRKLRRALRDAGMREIAADVDNARIGTIHGFCVELLQEFALRGGIPPRPDVLDEGESKTIASDAANAALREAAETGSMPELSAALGGRRLSEVVQAITKLAESSDDVFRWELGDSLRSHERVLLQLARRAAQLREQELKRRSAIDFDAMISRTRDLLRDNDSVRHAVQRRLRVLFIDEFQDVDPAQVEIARLLAGIDTADANPVRLVLVGDPKQSIYRFRRADVSLWNEIQAEFREGGRGRVPELRANFRSKDAILRFVDVVVGKKLSLPVCDDGVRRNYEVDYLSLDAGRTDSEGDACVEVLRVPPPPDGKAMGADARRIVEAQGIAARIQELKSSGRRFGDMAVLFTSWNYATVYENALRDAGIPTYTLRLDGFWEEREVLDCILALRAIRDPRDDVAVAGFLRSPFVGVRDDTLLALAQHKRGFHAAMLLPSPEQELIDRALNILTHYGELRDRIPLDDLLRRLIEETGFVAATAASGERSQQGVANLRKLLRMATDRSALSVGEFLREVESARDRRDRVGPERVYGEQADVVTLTSVHSAKGLEWSVVFWADISRPSVMPNRDTAPTLYIGRDGFRWKDPALVNDKGAEDDVVFKEFRDQMQWEMNAELARLWYVAATRAKDLLVLTGYPLGERRKADEGVASWLREVFKDGIDAEGDVVEVKYGENDRRYTLVARNCAQPTQLVEAEQISVVLSLPPAAVKVPVGRRRLSASQLMSFSKDAESWYKRYVVGVDPLRLVKSNGVLPNAAVIGEIVHAVLEEVDVDASDVEELLSTAIVDELGDDEIGGLSDELLAQMRAQTRAMIDTAVTNPVWRELALEPSARRELAFTRVLADGTTIEGALDLTAVMAEVTRVLDVKTGAFTSAEAMAKRYAMQAATYLAVTAAITGRGGDFRLLGTRNGEVVPVDVREPEHEIAEVVERLRGFELGLPM